MTQTKLTDEQRILSYQPYNTPTNATNKDHASLFIFSSANVYRDQVAVGTLENLLKRRRNEERHLIRKLLTKEANRVFNKQEKDYPSNVLDNVAWNLGRRDVDLIVPIGDISKLTK